MAKPTPQATELAALRERLAAAEAQLQAAREAESRNRLIADNDLVGFYVLEGPIIRYANNAAAAIIGYEPREVLGRSLLEFLTPQSRSEVAENLAKRGRGELESIRYMVSALHRDGRQLELEVYGCSGFYAGKPAVYGMFVDRTEAQRAESALRTSEARFQAFMDNTPAFAFMKDAEGHLVYANRALNEIHPAPPAGLTGKTPADAFPDETALAMAEADRKVLATRRPLEVTMTVPTARGPRTLLEFKFPVEDPSGQCLVGGVVVDITESQQTAAALAEKTRILEAILASMGDGVAVTDEEGRFILFNPAARRITGMAPEGARPGDWARGHGLFLPDRVTPVAPDALPLVRAARGESTDALELFVRDPARPAGGWVQITARPLVDDLGKLRGGVAVLRDTTELRHVLEELHKAEANYRTLVEELPVIAYRITHDPARPPLYVSPQIEAKLGFTSEEWMRTPGLWLQQLHPEDRERALAAFADIGTQTGKRVRCEYRMFARDGSLVHFRDEAVCVDDPRVGPPFVQGVLLDITKQETERGMRERLRQLSMDLVAVQEVERRRLGLELHDEVGQILTGLMLRLGIIATQSDAEIRSQLGELSAMVSEATVRVRQLSQNLRPAALDDLGLLPALGSHLRRYTKQTGIRVDFEHLGLERRRFTPEVETTVYRVVQEALNNVARHAHVDVVRLRVWADFDHVGVQIEDAGVGFDPVAAASQDHPSVGLTGMHERAELLDGTLTVDSAPGKGCRVTCELPIGPERDGS